MGDPRVSVVPVLDQWVREGKKVNRSELQSIIKELSIYKRFNHALENGFEGLHLESSEGNFLELH